MIVNFMAFQMLVGIGIIIVDFYINKNDLKGTFENFIIWLVLSSIVASIMYAVRFI